MKIKVPQPCLTLCDPMDCRNSPVQNTGVGSLSLLQGIFPTQGSNPVWHCRQILYQLSHQGSPRILEWVAYPFFRGSSQPRNWTEVSCISGESQPWDIGMIICLLKISAEAQQFSSVQSLSHVQLFATPRTAAHQASLSITNSQSLLKLRSIVLVMPSNHLILCCLFLLPPSIFPSIRVFSNESVLRISWPHYWSFSFSISPSIEYSGLISFRMDWLDLLAVQGTLKASPTPQFKNINSSALSFLYGPTLMSTYDYWKNHSFD